MPCTQNWGSAPYQPSEPINTVIDMWAIPAALIRGIWGPEFAADSLTLSPAIPGNLTNLTQSFPLVWGSYLIFPSAIGNGPITGVTLDGTPLPAAQWTAINVTLLWSSLPPPPANLSLVFTLGSGIVEHATASVAVSSSRFTSSLTRETATRALRTLAVLPATPILWLDATTLVGTLANGAPVSVWPDISGGGANASQVSPTLRPTFNVSGMGGGLPTVTFDGNVTFLSGSLLLPSESTIVAVVSNAPVPPVSDCCSGIFYSSGGCNGLGMKVSPPTSDDTSGNATVLMIDWSGSPDGGIDDLTGREVREWREVWAIMWGRTVLLQALVTSVLYNSSGSFSWAGGCLQASLSPLLAALSSIFADQTSRRLSPQSSEGPNGAAGGPLYMVGSRNNEDQRFFNGSISELLVFGRALNES